MVVVTLKLSMTIITGTSPTRTAAAVRQTIEEVPLSLRTLKRKERNFIGKKVENSETNAS